MLNYNFLKKQLLTFFVFLFLIFPMTAYGHIFENKTSKDILKGADYKTTVEDGKVELATKVGKVINVVLQFLGVVVLGVVLYAGFLWITAGGNEEQVAKAKKWIINSVIGSIVIGMAYAISAFILNL